MAVGDPVLQMTNPLVYETYNDFTPIDESGGGLSFSTAVGKWKRHGNIVFFAFRVTYPVTADGNYALIGGLPVAVNNNDRDNTPVPILSSGVTVSGMLNQGATNFGINTIGTFTGKTNADLSGLTLRGSGFYFTS